MDEQALPMRVDGASAAGDLEHTFRYRRSWGRTFRQDSLLIVAGSLRLALPDKLAERNRESKT